ncbi:MAG TPA: type II toxin-antitoxin system PemK/MazF family toxin [Stellaceae bacterium]|nr:type II toxin-antitoxin system PemK/MazF family toxin [Stellaceae bacterium]
MPNFKAWDIVRVPFPDAGRQVRQHRPALVIAGDDRDDPHRLLWLAMITSAAHRGWRGDVPISNLQQAGLPVASIVRPAKLATLEAGMAERLGTLPADDRVAVSTYLQDRLRPVLANSRSSRTYRLFAHAMVSRRQVLCTYDRHHREICPIILGRTKGEEMSLVYQFAGQSGSRLPPGGAWKCFRLAGVSDVRLREGDWVTGSGHSRRQSCVTDVELDVNPDSPYL